MCNLDAVIGPGPWLHSDYLMEESTFVLITGIILFCFAVIAISVIVLLVVMWKRRRDEQMKQEQDGTPDHSEKEES